MDTRQSPQIVGPSTSRNHRTARRWLAQLVPSAREPRDLTALATGMSGLAMQRQCVALELVAQASPMGVRRSFLVRAQTLEGRTHVISQLQAHYPQAQIRSLTAEEDPLYLHKQEAVSCAELRLGAPSYLPLRVWQRQGLNEEGTDPLLNVLAALKTLPLNHRAVVQLVLAPAPDTWSRRAQRFAQEPPLEEERFQRQLLARARPRATNLIEHGMFLEGLGLLLLVLLLGSWLWMPLYHLLPTWVSPAVSTLLRGQSTSLAPWQLVQLSIGSLVLLAGLMAIGLLVATVKKRLEQGWHPTRIYDPELVRQKTERIAYRATLRLYVIGPQVRSRVGETHTDSGMRTLARGYQLAAGWNSWLQGLHLFWRHVLPWRIRHQVPQGIQWIQRCWLLLRRRRKAAHTRRAVLARLITAYRAYHLASGNFFVPRRVPTWLAQRRLMQQAPFRLLRTSWWHACFLTPEEVASLYHLVQDADLRDLSFLERTRARTLPVPWTLATEPGQPLGINLHAGVRTPVCFPPGGLAYNTLALAGTGKGKSSLFAHLARVLLADPRKRGMVLVDPHGDLSLAFLGCVPLARRDEVVYLNLADTANPPGLNFLDMSSGQDRDKVVDMLLSIFKTLWKDNWGSRIENTMQYALLTLCEVNRARCRANQHTGPRRQCTILSVVSLLQRPDYRNVLLREFRDADIWSWWKDYYTRQELDDQK
ncbi:MAG: hypothetical protein J2P37_32215, partial [Ktedonobacteraceae bacterium]|nr:hypothetical protein [Ktedonobacteraceae bacterium]